MTYVPILSSEVDPKSPIDQNLMDSKIKNDLDDHEARILALEAGGGSGGGSSDPADDPRYGRVLAGFQTNEAILKTRRYKPFQSIQQNGNKQNNIEGFDPEGSDQSRFSGYEEGDGTAITINGELYQGYGYFIQQGERFQFRLKKGENMFGIGFTNATGFSDAVTVRVDGQSVTALGLYDENGVARANDFNANSGSQFGAIEWFFGLDGEEHVVEIENNDSTTLDFYFDFIEAGYCSKHGTFAVDKTLKVGAGRVNVRGTALNTVETDVTFDDTVGGGRTDAIKVSNAGTVSILKGLEPAMTQALPEISIAFSGAVSAVKVKNSYFFPSNGFVMVSHPMGGHHIASYTSKTETLIAQHQFNGMLWQSQPVNDFTPLSNFTSSTAADATGDLNINFWAGGGHIINSSNNKLDFAIMLNGTLTSHVATIPNGLYSADLVPLGRAIVAAMVAVKPLSNGEYYCEYNSQAQRWTIGVKGSEVSDLQLLFSTGSNAGTSIRTVLGYGATDLSGELAYLASNEVQSLAVRVFRADSRFRTANDPSILHSTAEGDLSDPSQLALADDYGLGYLRTVTSEYPYLKLYPDKDACGVSFSFMAHAEGSYLVASVDYGQHIYILQTDDNSGTGSKRPSIRTGFVSFPRGSRVVQIFQVSDDQFESGANPNQKWYFLGYRQFFTKPAIESLPTTESIIKSFDISPKQFFHTAYKALYSPQSTFDNIATTNYSGTWASQTGVGTFNDEFNYTSAANDYFDVTFVLVGDGGGIAIRSEKNVNYTDLASLYLVSGPTGSETNTLIQNNTCNGGVSENYDETMFRIVGLPAGTYTLRVKNRQSADFLISSFDVIDTVQPDLGQTTADLANSGQAISYPINTIKIPIQKWSYYLVPPYVYGGPYGEGIAYHQLATGTASTGGFPYYDDATVRQHKNYYTSQLLDSTSDRIGFFAFCKAYHTLESSFSGGSPMTIAIDGVAHANNLDNSKQVKGGGSPVNHNFYPLFQDHFKRFASGTMSNSTTFLISNTRGFKVGDTILVGRNATAEIKRVIATVNAGTSIVFTEAISSFASFTTANAAYVKSYNLHNLKIVCVNANNALISAVAYEPLDIQPSKDSERRMATSSLGEVATITFRDVTNDSDIYYPYFSDGRQATALESSISITGITSGTATYSMRRDLRDIIVSAGNIDVKITSVKRF